MTGERGLVVDQKQDPAHTPAPGTRRRPPGWFVVVLLLAVSPLLVSVVAQAHRGWRPAGDNAALAVLANDVLSPRTPLLGMPSTLSVQVPADERPQHLGPMLFWALAVPERLAGSAPIGILVGMALVNGTAIVIAGLVLARLTGPRAATGVLALVVVLTCSLGRQWIVDPWNAYAGLIPIFALCVLAWAAGAGMPRALLGLVVLASFVSQAHLLFAPIGLALLIVGICGAAIGFLRAARQGDRWRREAKITTAWSAALLLVCWSFPLWEQLRNRPGNFVNVANNFSGNPGEHPIGLDWAARLAVQGIGLPPLFTRFYPNTFDVVDRSWGSLGPVAVVSALVVLLGVVGLLVIGFRRRDPVVVAGTATSLVALAAVVATFARMPGTYFGLPPFYRTLQMWPVGCFVWSVVVVSVVRLASLPVAARRIGFVLSLAALVTAPFLIVFVDSPNPDDARTEDAVGRLVAAAAPALQRDEPYRVDVQTDDIFVGYGAQAGVFRELARRGFDPRVRADDLYLGSTHAAPPGAAGLVVQSGREVPPPSEPGAVLLAEADMTRKSDREAARRQAARIRAVLDDPSNLTEQGIAASAPDATGPDADLMRRLRGPDSDATFAEDLSAALSRGLVRNLRSIGKLIFASIDLQKALDAPMYRIYLVPRAA